MRPSVDDGLDLDGTESSHVNGRSGRTTTVQVHLDDTLALTRRTGSTTIGRIGRTVMGRGSWAAPSIRITLGDEKARPSGPGFEWVADRHPRTDMASSKPIPRGEKVGLKLTRAERALLL